MKNAVMSLYLRSKDWRFDDDHYPLLLQNQKTYAHYIGADYLHYTENDGFETYYRDMMERYPFLDHYLIVNFYKIQCMYRVLEEYDQVLYIDMDVHCMTRESFFDSIDLSRGIAISEGMKARTYLHAPTPNDEYSIETVYRDFTKRSPFSKYWNGRALCINDGLPTIGVLNTGIVGSDRYHMEKLDYFGDFDYTMELCNEVIENGDGMFPQDVVDLFGYDNETIWAYKTVLNDVPYQDLDHWHVIFDSEFSYIPENTKFLHNIKKDFQYVKNHIQHLYE